MTTPVRFAYADTDASHTARSFLPHLPITLRHGANAVTIPGLLDTGSTVNVLPYNVGLQLGLVWEQQPTRVYLTGNLARLPARGVIVSGEAASFPPVQLAFVWTQSTEVPVILGHVSFFLLVTLLPSWLRRGAS